MQEETNALGQSVYIDEMRFFAAAAVAAMFFVAGALYEPEVFASSSNSSILEDYRFHLYGYQGAQDCFHERFQSFTPDQELYVVDQWIILARWITVVASPFFSFFMCMPVFGIVATPIAAPYKLALAFALVAYGSSSFIITQMMLRSAICLAPEDGGGFVELLTEQRPSSLWFNYTLCYPSAAAVHENVEPICQPVGWNRTPLHLGIASALIVLLVVLLDTSCSRKPSERTSQNEPSPPSTTLSRESLSRLTTRWALVLSTLLLLLSMETLLLESMVRVEAQLGPHASQQINHTIQLLGPGGLNRESQRIYLSKEQRELVVSLFSPFYQLKWILVLFPMVQFAVLDIAIRYSSSRLLAVSLVVSTTHWITRMVPWASVWFSKICRGESYYEFLFDLLPYEWTDHDTNRTAYVWKGTSMVVHDDISPHCSWTSISSAGSGGRAWFVTGFFGGGILVALHIRALYQLHIQHPEEDPDACDEPYESLKQETKGYEDLHSAAAGLEMTESTRTESCGDSIITGDGGDDDLFCTSGGALAETNI